VAGELGESVYGLKDDFRPVVGDGMSCVAVAMPQSPSGQAHYAAAPVCGAFKDLCRGRCGRRSGCVSDGPGGRPGRKADHGRGRLESEGGSPL